MVAYLTLLVSVLLEIVMVMARTQEDKDRGAVISGNIIHNLKFANDIG